MSYNIKKKLLSLQGLGIEKDVEKAVFFLKKAMDKVVYSVVKIVKNIQLVSSVYIHILNHLIW